MALDEPDRDHSFEAAQLNRPRYSPLHHPRRVARPPSDLALNDKTIASQTYSAPGAYVLSSPPMKPAGDTAKLTITVDKSFSVPGDDPAAWHYFDRSRIPVASKMGD